LTAVYLSKGKEISNQCGIFGHGSFLNVDYHAPSSFKRHHPVFVAYPHDDTIVEKHGQWKIVNHTNVGAYANYNETFCNRVEPAVIGIQNENSFFHICCGGQNYHGEKSSELAFKTKMATNDCEVRDLQNDHQKIKGRITFNNMTNACRFFNPLDFGKSPCDYEDDQHFQASNFIRVGNDVYLVNNANVYYRVMGDGILENEFTDQSSFELENGTFIVRWHCSHFKIGRIETENNYATLCYYREFDESALKNCEDYEYEGQCEHGLWDHKGSMKDNKLWEANIEKYFHSEIVDFELFHKDEKSNTVQRTIFKFNHSQKIEYPLFSFEICESNEEFIRFFFLEFNEFIHNKNDSTFKSVHVAKHIQTISKSDFLNGIHITGMRRSSLEYILSNIQPSCGNSCKLSSFSAWNLIPNSAIHNDDFDVPHESILCVEQKGNFSIFREEKNLRCHALDVRTKHGKTYPIYPNYQTFHFPVTLLEDPNNFLKEISPTSNNISGITWDKLQHLTGYKSNKVIIILSIALILIYSVSIPIFNHLLKPHPISELPKSYFEKITVEKPIPEDHGSTSFTLPGTHQFFQDTNYDNLVSEKVRLKVINSQPPYDLKHFRSLEKEISYRTEITEVEHSMLTQSKVTYTVISCDDDVGEDTEYLPLLSQKLTYQSGSTDLIRDKVRPFAQNELLIYQILNLKFNDLIVELKGYYFKDHFTILVMKEYTDARRFLRNLTSNDSIKTRLVLTINALKIQLMLFDCTKAINDYFYPFLSLPMFLTKTKRIVHNDIKLENFFIDVDQEKVSLKIGDFGNSRITTDFLDFELDIKNLMKVLYSPVITAREFFAVADRRNIPNQNSIWQGLEEEITFKSIIEPLIDRVGNSKFTRKNEKQVEKLITNLFADAIEQCEKKIIELENEAVVTSQI